MATAQPTSDQHPPALDQWLERLKADVPPMTFKKGREYADSRRVTLVSMEGGQLSAKVLGSEGRRYDVGLRETEGKLESHCNCEAWNKYGPHCKHVVAAALVAAERLHPEAAAAEPGASPVANEPPPDLAPRPALAKLENWLGLSSLPDFEFLYRITPIRPTGGGRHWVIDVRRLDAQSKGPAHVRRLLAAGTRIAPADERVFQALARHETRFDSRIVLSDDDLVELLDLLRHRTVIYRGTPLSFSTEPARPQVSLESRPEGAIARIKVGLPGGAALDLHEVILLAGRRTYVIAGQTLHALEPELPPRLLRKWLLEPQMAFPASELDRVLTFFGAHLPRFRMALRAEGIEVEESAAPRFVVTVEGSPESARVQLGARYGHTTVPVSPVTAHLGYASGAGPDGKRLLYRRMEEPERAAAKSLIEGGLTYDAASGTYVAAGDLALAFWQQGLSTLPKEWEIFGARAPKVRIRRKMKPRIRVAMSGVNWFELDAEFVTDDQAIDLGAVRMWLDSGRKYVLLKDGTYAEADPAELKRAADLLEEAGALPGKKSTRLPLFQAGALDMLSELGDFAEVEAKARKAMRELQTLSGLAPATAPRGLHGKLRHYQEAGLAWLAFLHRYGLSGVLADDMGLGKTVQALALLQRVKNEEGSHPSLVVAPTSVLANWEREAERFTPGLTSFVWHGQDRRERTEQLKSVDLVLTSYALVRRDVAELAPVKFRYVILDEAQNIKNADSATAQACKALPADRRLALTGTPLENRLAELWSLFDFLMPGFLGASRSFAEHYETPIQVAGDVDVRERLKRRIRPFILRRLKTEVAKDLPPKTESVAWCDMDPGQAALYREVLEDSRRKVYETIEKVGFKRSRISILAALMKLRQICCDPRLLKLPPGTLLPPSAKLERFGLLVDDLVDEGHRALVFSQFTEMLALLTAQADEKKIPYQYLDGRTKDRMARVDAFNDPKGPPLFFISLKAGGTGLNLTAADYVLHYDPWWNPAVEDQATDRTHRIGQTKSVFSYKLITRGTVEEKILELQKRKRELAAGVLGGDADLGKMLTEKDVEDLLRSE